MVIKPVITHTKMSQPALPTLRVISALTIKMPEPIMDPATIIVPSSNPREGLKWGVVSAIETEDKKIMGFLRSILFLIGGIQPIQQIGSDIIDRVFVINE